MSNEELLKPRFKVIADYPGNVVDVGLVLEKRDGVDATLWSDRRELPLA
jgi:hypothetical protein